MRRFQTIKQSCVRLFLASSFRSLAFFSGMQVRGDSGEELGEELVNKSTMKYATAATMLKSGATLRAAVHGAPIAYQLDYLLLVTLDAPAALGGTFLANPYSPPGGAPVP